ncbi:MAG: phenylalanine--tRNA ligase beta subunit-related protein [Euryarchaeota archaeon]|nr:phenylalanine--tRNA ligase beta subunit-related protein [Euryarchaeota archaeon]
MVLIIDPEVRAKFLRLQVLVGQFKGVKIKRGDAELQTFKEQVIKQVKEEYKLEKLKDVQIFRAYRDFFWRIGIDPTKVRPAAEALIRRILGGKSIPNINTLVDVYNLASIKTGIALAAFDEDKLQGNLVMRFAKEGEKFLGIGMKESIELEGTEIVISDKEKLIAIYPHRDSDQTKVTDMTRNILLLVCGVPGIEEKILQDAGNVAVKYIIKYCGGEGKLD